jgi:hypothetical protein
MTAFRFAGALLFVAAAIAPSVPAATPASSAPARAPAERLVELEDREAIRLLLRDYGRLLDERRFDEFGLLFTDSGEYVAGGTTRGPKQIADGLRKTFAGNSLGLAEPNFHVLFNERIVLAGNRATASSQSFFVAPGPDGAPRIVMMASYEDELLKTAAGWRFSRRLVKGNMAPRPQQKAASQAAAP